MGKLRNLPDALRLIRRCMSFDHYSRGIDAARETGDPAAERLEIAASTVKWARAMAEDLRMDVQVTGRENIPENDGIVFISNHQGYADIIAMFIALEGKQIGFIAKDSLASVPFIGRWIRIIRGLFIKRGNAKEALHSMQEGADLVKQGYNLVIFPEGTRSRGPVMGSFKKGSFKLATRAKAPIVPVTIDGTYHTFEEKGFVQPATIRVIIHPAMETASLSRREMAEIEQKAEDVIRTSLQELQREESKS